MQVNLYEVTFQALRELWVAFLTFLPELLGALIVLIIGWFIAAAVGKLVASILEKLRFNQVFDRANWRDALAKAEITVDPSSFVGAIFKWVLVIVFLFAAADVLNIDTSPFQGILNFLPNVVAAAFIFVAAVIVADIVEKVLRAGAEGMQVGYGHLVGAIARWSIWIAALIAILQHLGIAGQLLNTVFVGFIALLTLAGGLAFGLGGKEVAAELLQDLRRKLRG